MSVTALPSARAPLTGMPHGLMHCPVTPFTERGAIDLDTYARLIEFHLAQGADSLCVVLHVAESLNLRVDERQSLVKEAVAVVAGRVPVIAHVSMPGTDDTLELARHAKLVGADAICVLSPYYWRLPEEAIYEHFSTILSGCDIPLVAYNSPNFQNGVALGPAFVVRLLERFPHFIGLKEASHNFESFIELRRAAVALRPQFGLVVGVEYVLPSLTLGGVGAMSVFSSVAPRLVRALYEATLSGDWLVARKLQDRASALWQLIKPEYPSPLKAAMAMLDRPVGAVRGPMRPVTGAGLDRLRAALSDLGVFSDEPMGWY